MITDGDRFGGAKIGVGALRYPSREEIAGRVQRFADEELGDAAPAVITRPGVLMPTRDIALIKAQVLESVRRYRRNQAAQQRIGEYR